MRRDPRQLGAGTSEEEEAKRSSGRAWGVVLGAWAVAFALLAIVGVPLLFSVCERVAG